jgi:group I intron endonuclease
MIATYILTDTITGKFYVGSSGNIRRRLTRHFSDLRNGNHHCAPLQEIWVDDDRIRTTTIVTDTRESAYDLEQDLLEKFKDSPYLLNVSLGARGGDTLTRHPQRQLLIENLKNAILHRYSQMTVEERKKLYGKSGRANWMWGKTHSPEARAKISKANLGITHRSGFTLTAEHRTKISEFASRRTGDKNAFYGRSHSQATRERISDTKRQQGLIPANVRQVMVDDHVYASLTEASRQLGVSPALMVHRIKSDSDRYKGYKYLT